MLSVASLFSDITPCNAHLDRLARKSYEGIRAAGGVPQIFGAPTASDAQPRATKPTPARRRRTTANASAETNGAAPEAEAQPAPAATDDGD